MSKKILIDATSDEGIRVAVTENGKLDDFEIEQVYRYEGDSNPSDESTVYGIASKDGLRGILVTAYGAYTDGMSAAMLRKLSLKNE